MYIFFLVVLCIPFFLRCIHNHAVVYLSSRKEGDQSTTPLSSKTKQPKVVLYPTPSLTSTFGYFFQIHFFSPHLQKHHHLFPVAQQLPKCLFVSIYFFGIGITVVIVITLLSCLLQLFLLQFSS